MVKRKVTVIIFSKLLKINFMNIILPALLKKKNQVKSESGLCRKLEKNGFNT